MLAGFYLCPQGEVFFIAPADVGATQGEVDLLRVGLLHPMVLQRIENNLAYRASRLKFCEPAGNA